MKRITPSMIAKGGKRYCTRCKLGGKRNEAQWTHYGESYCEAHRAAYSPSGNHESEADYEISRRYGI